MDLSSITRHGIFSTSDARTLGLGSNHLRSLVRSGACIRLSHGWYAPVASAMEPADRHRLASLAIGREYAGRAAISHYSALVVARVETFAVDLDTVHLSLLAKQGTRPGPRPRTRPGVSRRRDGLVLHRSVPGLTISTDEPAPGEWLLPAVVPTAWAVVQTGLVAGGVAALVAADSALRSTLVTRHDLTAALERFRRHPGVAAVRAALVQADSRHESPGETRSAWLLRRLGFEVEPQVEVDAEGRRYRADFRVLGTKVLIEFDGAVKYTGDRRALFEEKRREDALRREGWIVVRLVWDELDQPELVRRRVREAIALAGRA